MTVAMPSGYRWSNALSEGLSQNTRMVFVGGGPEVGPVVGDVVGCTVGDGDTVRDGLAVGVVVAVLPLQVTPLRVKLAGTGLLELFHEPLKPNEVLPPVASTPL